MSTPRNATRPDCGGVSPMIERIVVDLPTPLRPSRHTHSPVLTSIETPKSTRDRPYAVWMSRTSSSGARAAALTNLRGGPRHGPPRPPSLGRVPAQPWRASGLPHDVSPTLSEIDAPHLGVRAHVGGRAVGDHAALVQHGDLLRDGED